MEWLLTDEEIKRFQSLANDYANDLANSTEGHFKQEDVESIYMDAERSICLAQAKKLAAWFREHFIEENYIGDNWLNLVFGMTIEEWQTFKKEIGGE